MHGDKGYKHMYIGKGSRARVQGQFVLVDGPT